MASKQRQPIGIELAKRNLITEEDINKALEYQRSQIGLFISDRFRIGKQLVCFHKSLF